MRNKDLIDTAFTPEDVIEINAALKGRGSKVEGWEFALRERRSS